MKTKYLIIALVLASLNPVFGQQDPMFTQYMFNTLAINPAYAGSRHALNISALYRNQWINMEGAPVTQTVFIHSPIPYTKSAAGVSIVNDEIGPTRQTMFYGDYSYTIELKKFNLAMGVKAGADWRQTDAFGLMPESNEYFDTGDEAVDRANISKVYPDLGAGIYTYSNRWYLGFSVPKILENNIVNEPDQETEGNAERQGNRHYFFIAGAMLPINPWLQFKPTTFVKATESAPLQIDVTTSFLFADRVLAGAMLRSQESWGMLFMVEAFRGLRVGYSYDRPLSELRTVTNGSHELMISYDFVFNPDKIKSPRYF